MDYIKSPEAHKSLRAFFKMSKRFHAYAETFFKKPETFFGGTYRKTVRFPAIDSFE